MELRLARWSTVCARADWWRAGAGWAAPLPAIALGWTPVLFSTRMERGLDRERGAEDEDENEDEDEAGKLPSP